MKQFTFSEMNRQCGDVLDTALAEPVALTKHGKEKLILLPAADYHRLTERSASLAFTVEDAPEAVHDELMAGLNSIIIGAEDV